VNDPEDQVEVRVVGGVDIGLSVAFRAPERQIEPFDAGVDEDASVDAVV
jgi:hypothetical protein